MESLLGAVPVSLLIGNAALGFGESGCCVKKKKPRLAALARNQTLML
jgi:hypothetical protein